ncbi:DNA mismatch repair protein MutS [Criblamydia sequanensis]|uniref:DNA mismatch repair protein MutS n=1 Tax=Candidatus Criblamydia sequanensis CRIB-18 TaxID=1437425 RepID=A0A090D0P1_9BACT|nr:DNA mismatch repair protein MutS [Criblamydia sequanensis]CDR33425.1 DNA mismatch repair protein mutS [Criblamydia sequanensis CRIB-18]
MSFEDSKNPESKISPMMAQWYACKEKAGDALLLFRLGDFYESFNEDAVLLSKTLDLTLTKRQEIPMAGIPSHASESYIDKLIAKGFRVAIAEQIEDPKETKGIVKREVVRFVSPGALVHSSLLEEKNNNYFAAITEFSSFFGLSFIDLTTSAFYIVEFDSISNLRNELWKILPREIIVSKKFASHYSHLLHDMEHSFNPLIQREENWKFSFENSVHFLLSHFKTATLDGFGLKEMNPGIQAGGCLLKYLKENLLLSLDHIQSVKTLSENEFLSIDPATLRNLELTHSLKDKSQKNTLLHILDETLTPMGGRLLTDWIQRPLLSLKHIQERQKAVEVFVNGPKFLETLRYFLNFVKDLERLMMRISSATAAPRDVGALFQSLQSLPNIKNFLKENAFPSATLQKIEANIHLFPETVALLSKALNDSLPLRLSDGNIFRFGYNKELDDLKTIRDNGDEWLVRYQADLREKLGIKTLKVGFNRMFGYYIEVSKGQAHQMPSSFQRRQTLVNGERFISDELKSFEEKVLSAEEKISSLEQGLFTGLLIELCKIFKPVMQTADALGKLDALQSLALTASNKGWRCPIVEDSFIIEIKAGRHPIIEASECLDRFIPNDTLLDDKDHRLILLTGPNMAGKSTYIRQVALITILAQMGSYVPAEHARIGIVDKIFTRIGAHDDLARGQSTFMVEMTESAHILHHATDRSLVILDEIGRGTSTYDGISIAWSIAEYLLLHEGKRARTLFATHYFELTKLEELIPGAVNYTVAVHEERDQIFFLHKIIKGSTDRSYGIHVGQLAGLPLEVIQRSKEILVDLESVNSRKINFTPKAPKKITRKMIENKEQMNLFAESGVS